MMLFGKRLRDIRMKRHLTQQYVADLVDISLVTYQKYEQGDRSPCYEILINLANVLDVSIDWLMGRDKWLNSHGVSFDELL